MDEIQIINSLIVDMDRIAVRGAENMAIVLGCIQKLDTLRKKLTEDEQNV